MMEAFDLDTERWLSEREAATSGYLTETILWEQNNPRPQLSEYMKYQGQF